MGGAALSQGEREWIPAHAGMTGYAMVSVCGNDGGEVLEQGELFGGRRGV